jgi:regulator of protease activity HflC (stomatin/prohibitin superfamily)
LWKAYHEVDVEIVDVAEPAFTHDALEAILKWPHAAAHLAIHEVAQEKRGLLFINGVFQRLLEPGWHVFWKTARNLRVETIELREEILDVSGQEIMTADRVTLRLNVLVTFKVVDPVRAVSAVSDYRQTLYRETQLVLRAIVGGRELDALLADKHAVAEELEAGVRKRADEVGVRLISLGIRDIILPGEMKELLNRVTEARKAAEANLITRREETASMRMQANTAKLLESNAVLMRLRELEVLEKVADKATLHVLLGDKGLTDRVVNLL